MRTSRVVGWLLVVLLFLGAFVAGLGFWRSGYRAYVIHTGSMEPTLVAGDLIIDRPASAGYRPGEIITFRHSAGPDLVTHRITDVTTVDLTAGAIHTKGDANPSADVWDIPPSLVQGSVQWRIPHLGYVAVFLQQPTGFAAMVTVIIGLVLLWGLFFPPAGPSIRSPDESAAVQMPVPV